MKHFMNLKQECFQKKLVRFDNKNIKLTHVLLSNFKVYKNIIRRSIMHAKRNYYCIAFNRYLTNMKKTWQTISETLNHRKGNRDFPQ